MEIINNIIKWIVGSDVGEFARRGDWKLGFIANYNNYINLALFGVFALLVYLTIRSYRREGTAPLKVKATLAAIRITIIVLAMVILFQPALVLRVTTTIHKSLVLLIDDSLSMSFNDRYSDKEQHGRMKEFLALDKSEKSEDTPENPVKKKSLTEMSRREIILRALARKDGAIPRLADDHPLIVMKYSTAKPGSEDYTQKLGTINRVRSGDVPADDAQRQKVAEQLGELLKGLKADGHETNIGRTLRDTLQQMEGRQVSGIVLFSEGQVTAQKSPLKGAKEYARKRHIPLYAVSVGDPTPPKDMSMIGLQVPRHVRRGANVELAVTLAHRNLVGQNATIRLFSRAYGKKDWIDTGVVEVVELKAPRNEKSSRTGQCVQTVDLHFEPKELGEFVYKAVVDPQQGEDNIDDNSAQAAVRVSDDKIKVLLISGDAGWEFRYLRNLLLRSPRLYRLSVWQQNADKEINQVASKSMLITRLPRTLEELMGSAQTAGKNNQPGYDLVILYDPKPTKDGFDANFLDILKTFVQRYGKGLCYIAGNKYTDSTLVGQKSYKPLRDMLPVILAPNPDEHLARLMRRTVDPWPVVLTSYGVDHPITRLGGSADDSKGVWRTLPPIYWTHTVRKAKPTARVLLENGNPMKQTAKNTPEPILAVHSFGKGRVVYLGMDSTWRWRYVRDGAYQRRFWGNIVRYLATLGSQRVVLSTGGDRFAVGDRITIEVEAYDQAYKPLEKETFSLKMTNIETGKTRILTLKGVKKRPGCYKISIDDAGTGNYELTPEMIVIGDSEKAVTKRIMIEPPQAENARREADFDTMMAVASRAKNFMTIDQVDQLADLIPPGKRTTVREIPKELWDSRLPLLLIVILLGIEWVLRKKNNMT